MTDEHKQHSDAEHDDGITAGGLTGKVRLPASMANAMASLITAMAPASVYFMYAVSLGVIVLAICYGISRVVESMK